MHKRQNIRISEAVLLFLFFNIIGWLYEVVLAFYYGHGFINRGFLFGPYLPLYGTGTLLLILCLKKLMDNQWHIRKVNITPAVVFLMIMLITTALEYIVGWFLETVFHQRFWDYSDYTYQLHGRICLSASLRFGLGGMLFLYILVPFFRMIIKKIPEKFRGVIAALIAVVFIIDLIATLYISSRYGFNPALAQPR